jgi:peptide/nickel transport system substrate-binding protein
MQSGEMDWWEYPTPDYATMLKANKNLVFKVNDPTGTPSILRFNHLHPPFDNPAARRAILGAMNQDDFMTAIAGTDPSMWKTPCGIFPLGTPFASTAGLPQLAGERDYDKVKRDLAAAGYKGERVVVLGASDLPVIKAAADVGSDMLTKCGMNVDYAVSDWGTLVQRRASKAPPDKGGWNVFFTGFSGLDFMTPAGHLPLRGNGEGAWFGWPTAPKLEELRQSWLVAPDFAAQKAICEQIQQQAFIDVPYIPTGMYFQPGVWRTDLTGVLQGLPIFWNVRRA